MTTMASKTLPALVIGLSYSPYRVWIENPWDRKGSLTSIDLSKNSQLRTGKKHQALVREGKRQMAADVDLLMLRASWPKMHLPLTMDATIRRRTKAHADDDGAWVGLYAARDAIAAGLSINDADIVTGKITWATGEPEETLIEIHEQH